MLTDVHVLSGAVQAQLQGGSAVPRISHTAPVHLIIRCSIAGYLGDTSDLINAEPNAIEASIAWKVG